MNHEKLSHIAQNPSEINADDARELEALTRSFPYFSLPFALLTRFYSDNNDYRYEDTLHKTALRVNDREWLYALVHQSELQEQIQEPTKIEEPVSSAEPILVEEVFEEISNLESPESNGVEPPESEQEIKVPEPVFSPVFASEEPVLAEITFTEAIEEPEPLETEVAEEQPADEIPTFVQPAMDPATDDEEFMDTSGSRRAFEPDMSNTHVGADLMEDEVFEEILQFDSNPLEVPELMGNDENVMELLAELDIAGPMIIPDKEENKEETKSAPARVPAAGAVYNIEDYYPQDRAENAAAPTDFFSWLGRPTYDGTEPERKVSPEMKSKLIDRFIENPASISRPKAEFFSPVDMAKKSEVFPDDIVTETLAGAFIKQDNFSGAIRIYEKLILKFPEKTTYFAALIEKIKKENHL